MRKKFYPAPGDHHGAGAGQLHAGARDRAAQRARGRAGRRQQHQRLGRAAVGRQVRESAQPRQAARACAPALIHLARRGAACTRVAPAFEEEDALYFLSWQFLSFLASHPVSLLKKRDVSRIKKQDSLMGASAQQPHIMAFVSTSLAARHGSAQVLQPGLSSAQQAAHGAGASSTVPLS